MSRKDKRRWHRTRIHRRQPPGSGPGMVVDPQAPKPIMRVMAFGPDGVVERTIESPEAVGEFVGVWPVTWLNIDGLGDVGTITQLGSIFNLHVLALEDVVNVHQRAKVEQYPDYYFIVGRMVEMAERVETEQLSLFLGRNFVLTFQELPGDCFDPVRERIRKAGGRIRSAGPDYLAYTLIDAFVDHYFPVLEHYGEVLEALEDDVIMKPQRAVIARIHDVKRDLLTLRRAAWPLREALTTLYRETTPMITAETRLYLRDSYDHSVQIIDLLENYRDIASSLTDIYLSSVSNRMNEIMKVLTIFTTIFIPLNFIAGIYGMNFNTERSPLNMPELNWYWGYPFALGIMLLLGIVMLIYFGRKGWLKSDQLPTHPPEHNPGSTGTTQADRG
jgi:magnesium transporter